jgi:hypothetical protein
MSVEDFQINAYVRQVLSRCWVDLAQVNYGSVGATVYFHGRFERMRVDADPTDDPLSKRRTVEEMAEDIALLERVEKEVRRQPSVKDVVFRLENFRKSLGKWRPLGAEE